MGCRRTYLALLVSGCFLVVIGFLDQIGRLFAQRLGLLLHTRTHTHTKRWAQTEERVRVRLRCHTFFAGAFLVRSAISACHTKTEDHTHTHRQCVRLSLSLYGCVCVWSTSSLASRFWNTWNSSLAYTTQTQPSHPSDAPSCSAQPRCASHTPSCTRSAAPSPP